jgi:PAS domain S-box-containing protein
MNQPLRVLIVEDSEDDMMLLLHTLRRGGYAVASVVVDNAGAMRQALESSDWDVITSDHAMPHFSAPDALALAYELRPEVPFLIVSGEIDLNLGVSLMRGGAKDYIQKRELARLVPAIERVLREVELDRERQRTETALRENTELLNLFIHHSPIYSFIKEVSPNRSLVLRASENYVEMIGIPGHEMIGKTMEELFPPEYAAKFTADDWEVVSKGEVLRLDEELNGRSYKTIKFPIVQGGKTLLAGYTIDITESKQAEEALRQSENRFRALLQNVSTVAVQGYAMDGTTQYWNAASERIYGYSAQEALGRSLLDLIIPPEMRSEVSQAIQQMAETGQPIPAAELSLMRKDGLRVPVYSSHAIVTGPGGAPELFCIDVDMAEHRQAEAALRESEDKFKYVFDHSVAAKSITLPSGELHVNQTFCEILGYSAEELAQRKWQDITHPDDLELTQNAIDALLSGEKETVRFIKRYIHKNGSIVWADLGTALRRDQDGKPLYYVTTFIDITERKRIKKHPKLPLGRGQKKV